MVLAGFLFYFQFMTLQLRLESGLEEVGAQIARIDHLENVIPDIFTGTSTEEDGVFQKIREYAGKLAGSGLTGAYVKYALVEEVGKAFLDGSCVKNGSSGITCYVLTQGPMLDLRVTYQICIPFMPGQTASFQVTQRLVRRMWVGAAAEAAEEASAQEQDTKTEERTVYMTKHGTVYHLYKDCRSLKRSIRSCLMSAVEAQRNNDGARYTACEYCVHGTANAIVYITDEGRRYHNSISCSALLRYIEEKTMDDVGTKGLCSYCRSRQEEEQDGLD
jgi:hypothetical protein